MLWVRHLFCVVPAAAVSVLLPEVVFGVLSRSCPDEGLASQRYTHREVAMLRRFRSEKERWGRIDTSGQCSKKKGLSGVGLVRQAPEIRLKLWRIVEM